MEIIVSHYANCNANYPEKLEGEKAKQIIVMNVYEMIIHQCVDCGAFVVVEGSIEEEGESNG